LYAAILAQCIAQKRETLLSVVNYAGVPFVDVVTPLPMPETTLQLTVPRYIFYTAPFFAAPTSLQFLVWVDRIKLYAYLHQLYLQVTTMLDESIPLTTGEVSVPSLAASQHSLTLKGTGSSLSHGITCRVIFLKSLSRLPAHTFHLFLVQEFYSITMTT